MILVAQGPWGRRGCTSAAVMASEMRRSAEVLCCFAAIMGGPLNYEVTKAPRADAMRGRSLDPKSLRWAGRAEGAARMGALASLFVGSLYGWTAFALWAGFGAVVFGAAWAVAMLVLLVWTVQYGRQVRWARRGVMVGVAVVLAIVFMGTRVVFNAGFAISKGAMDRLADRAAQGKPVVPGWHGVYRVTSVGVEPDGSVRMYIDEGPGPKACFLRGPVGKIIHLGGESGFSEVYWLDDTGWVWLGH